MGRLQIVGVDISKNTFDVSFGEHDRYVFDNTPEGFASFSDRLHKRCQVVMEASGTYFLRLATYLHAQGYHVSVVNPATVSYFARMRLSRVKTDRTDAEMIRQFGEAEALPQWLPADAIFTELNQLDSHLNGLQRDQNCVIGRLEALTQCVTVNEHTRKDLEDQLEDLKHRIKLCEKELVRLTKLYFPELLALLTSIQGIGNKTAVMFIVLTHGFTRFVSPKSFSAYLGMSSFVRQSGTSIRGGGGISKMGNSRMRQLLYMAALTAKRKNKACQVFAERLKDNGKPAKVVRIAVANKLIRQAFAVVTKQEIYAESYA